MSARDLPSLLSQTFPKHDKKKEKQRSSSPKALAGSGRTQGSGLYTRLASLYERMESAYNLCAGQAGLTCRDCTHNCCTSFFQHHTYVEWAYLWRGLQALEKKQLALLKNKAGEYVEEARQQLALNALPAAMCPLNIDGLCVLYSHRLMICRLHGTRNVFTLPDGRQQIFPGCERFTSLPCSQSEYSGTTEHEKMTCPTLDRTSLYKELAQLELEFLQKGARPLPRVNITIAEMIVMGPPNLR